MNRCSYAQKRRAGELIVFFWTTLVATMTLGDPLLTPGGLLQGGEDGLVTQVGLPTGLEVTDASWEKSGHRPRSAAVCGRPERSRHPFKIVFRRPSDDHDV